MSPRLSMSGANPRRKSRYRKWVAFPLNLCKQCHINLEEGNHIGAITLLTDSLLSGTSHPNRADINVFAPLPFHIEIVSILLVHPTTTTQSSPDLRAELASRCISFLRSTLAILGPLNAKLGEAFSYHHPQTGRRRRRGGYDSSASSNSDDEDEELQSMRCTVAREGRIRNCAKDFWHVVGWALNCSVAYPHRWKYWQVWLDYMLDVLDADWNEREAQDLEEVGVSSRMELGDRPELECSFPRLNQSLLADYLYDIRGSSAVKRVVGAAFADGGPDDLRTYPEVFKNETQKVRPQKRKREEQNLELDSSDFESGGHSSSLASPSSPQDVSDEDSTDPWLGGPDSMILRQRVLTLLSRICHYLPDRFISLTDLYVLYYTNVKLLPIPGFSLLFSQSRSLSFPTEVYVSITQSVLSRLLQSGAPSPQDYRALDLDPDDHHNDELTQHILEHCYLPWTANTSSISDNAKVSILLECLLRLLLKKVGLDHAARLKKAVETGIRAREGKAKLDGRRRRMDGEEERAREWLAASGERLRGLVGVVEGLEGDG